MKGRDENMITDEMIKAQIALCPAVLTEEGARKIIEHKQKNEAQYGEFIYLEYYTLLFAIQEARKQGNIDVLMLAKEKMSDYMLRRPSLSISEPAVQEEVIDLVKKGL